MLARWHHRNQRGINIYIDIKKRRNPLHLSSFLSSLSRILPLSLCGRRQGEAPPGRPEAPAAPGWPEARRPWPRARVEQHQYLHHPSLSLFSLSLWAAGGKGTRRQGGRRRRRRQGGRRCGGGGRDRGRGGEQQQQAAACCCSVKRKKRKKKKKERRKEVGFGFGSESDPLRPEPDPIT